METKLKRKKKSSIKTTPTREPDIAYWFDEIDDSLFVVKIKRDIKHMQVALAFADLMARLVESDGDTLVGSFEENEAV